MIQEITRKEAVATKTYDCSECHHPIYVAERHTKVIFSLGGKYRQQRFHHICPEDANDDV